MHNKRFKKIYLIFPKDLNTFLKIIGKIIKNVNTSKDSTFSRSNERNK